MKTSVTIGKIALKEAIHTGTGGQRKCVGSGWAFASRAAAHTIVAACAVLAAGVTRAQLLDSVDVQAKGGGAEIMVRFATRIQYVRHAPQAAGKTLRIYLRLTGGAGMEPGDPLPSTLRAPKNELGLAFAVTYPESGGALLVEFDRQTRFSVHPGPDGRSISILVPSSPDG